MEITDIEFYSVLVIIAILYCVVIIRGVKYFDKKSDIIDNTDHIFTDFGTENER